MIRNRLLELNTLNLQGSDLLHQMPHPVLLLDSAGLVVYANPSAEQLLGISKQAKELHFENLFQGDVAFSSRVKFLNATQEALVFLAKTVHPSDKPPLKLKLSAHYAQQEQVFLLQVLLSTEPDFDESFFKSVIENIPADIAVFDQHQNYLYVNPNAVRDPEIRSWLIGKNDLQYARMRNLPEQMAELRRARFGQLIESGVDQYSFEETTDVKGVRSSKLRLMKAVRNPDGTFRYAIGYGVSIDQLKAYESKIKNQEIAMEASTVGIAVLNEQGAYTYLNEAHVKMYGFSDQSELIGKTWKVFYSPEEAERIEQQIFPTLIKDGKWMGETSGVVRGTGTPIHTDLSLTRLPDGGMVCVCRDVTSRKKKDLANQRMAIVASKTTNLVIIGSASGRIEWVNDAFLRQTGFSMEEIMGLHPVELLTGSESDPNVVEAFREHLQKGLPFSGELLTYDRSDRRSWQHLNLTPVFDEKGLLRNWVYVITNISLIKEAEEHVKLALEKEQRLGEMKSRFVSMASHEFRTPLAGIVTSIELVRILLEKGKMQLDDRVLFHLQKAMGEVSRLTHLMDNILLIGRAGSGRIRFNPENLSFREFLDNFMADFTLIWSHRNLEVRFEPTHDIVFDFDSQLMRHILSNLIGNAFKYSPEHSPVTLECSVREDRFCLRIIDQGIGIPEDEQVDLFKSFFRASNSEHVDGTGMGLVIVKQFVDLHQGSIRIDSRLQSGCIVDVCLPLNQSYDKSPADH